MIEYYDNDVISYIDNTILLNPFFEEWFEIVEHILLNDEFQRRKIFPHHHNMTVWDHSILVSFKSFLLAKQVKADEKICAIAGLLHDFYPWSWINTKELEEFENGKYLEENKRKKTFFELHGFTHGKAASINYVKFFPELENKKITNSIKNHMFPLTIVPPRYKEGIIITIIDKINSAHEMPSPVFIKDKIKKEIFIKRMFNKIIKQVKSL